MFVNFLMALASLNVIVICVGFTYAILGLKTWNVATYGAGLARKGEICNEPGYTGLVLGDKFDYITPESYHMCNHVRILTLKGVKILKISSLLDEETVINVSI